MQRNFLYILFLILIAAGAYAGPYTEIGIDGYIGDDYKHANPLSDADAEINPIFRGWAKDYVNYLPADTVWLGTDMQPYPWNTPSNALNEASGDFIDIVSLGDLDAAEISQGKKPGEITLIFGNPQIENDSNHIRNVKGYDFAVFENGGNGVFAELAFVEVSSDGINFARFPAISLTEGLQGGYGEIDVTDVYNLAGKHANFGGICTGTPFDLSELADEPNVVNGLVDVNNICFVKIVDIPGSGDFFDSLNHPIFDAWLTYGSGGFDLEAIGSLNEQQYSADINLDGIVNGEDFSLFISAWMSSFGDVNWIGRCDLAMPKDDHIDFRDYSVFASQWHKKELWRE
ncbi:MAG: hypothetical protein ABFD79_18845 [Phycisphaerales bacterium]